MPRFALLLAQAEPVPQVPWSVADLIILAPAMVAWAAAIARYRVGLPLVEPRPHRIVPWSGLTTFGVVMLYFVLTNVAGSIVLATWASEQGIAVENVLRGDELRNPRLITRILMGQSLASLMFIAVTPWLMLKYTPATTGDMGLSLARIARDVVLGIIAFFAVISVVLLLQYVVVSITGAKPEHPIFDAWRQGGDWNLLLWSMLAAVLSAPLVEEFLFRGIIQGWLERVFARPVETAENLAESHGDFPAFSPENPSAEPIVPAPALVQSTSPWPIVLSALVFSLMHVGQGTGPILLFFFAVGVGYLYRQTHSIWPGVVVHFMLNAMTMLLLVMTK